MSSPRLAHLRRFYDLLDEVRSRLGGFKRLAECDGRMHWPHRGVYFFFEEGETRSHSGRGRRLVRIGTHAAREGSEATLWSRLKQHKGTGRTGGGSHRASVFRLLIGDALQRSAGSACSTWGKKPVTSQVKRGELPYEQMVSRYIGRMPFLWVEADDQPSAASVRSRVERNAIALASAMSARAAVFDPASPSWLGRHSHQPAVRQSGLWNVLHVEADYAPTFLEEFDTLIRAM